MFLVDQLRRRLAKEFVIYASQVKRPIQLVVSEQFLLRMWGPMLIGHQPLLRSCLGTGMPPPPILGGLHLQVEEQIKFFSTDLWHNVHLGVCKHFVASAIVCIAESRLGALPDGSMEVKFKWLTDIYRAYFRSQNMTAFVSELSRDTLNFPASTASPLGKWSKGAASTELMLFLDHFGRNYLEGKTDDTILLSIVSCSHWFNLFIYPRWCSKTC